MEKSFLQQEAELSRFQGSSANQEYGQPIQNAQIALPNATSEYYDPNDPRADWTGHVIKSSAKKTFQQHTATNNVLESIHYKLTNVEHYHQRRRSRCE